MSTLRTDNLTTSTGVGGAIPMLTAIQGTAKAWLNLNGTGTIAERDSFNVSSITDNGVGDYTLNFSTARPNANYAIQTTGNENTGGAGRVANAPRATAPTTSAARLGTWDSANTATDHEFLFVNVHGDPH